MHCKHSSSYGSCNRDSDYTCGILSTSHCFISNSISFLFLNCLLCFFTYLFLLLYLLPSGSLAFISLLLVSIPIINANSQAAQFNHTSRCSLRLFPLYFVFIVTSRWPLTRLLHIPPKPAILGRFPVWMCPTVTNVSHAEPVLKHGTTITYEFS